MRGEFPIAFDDSKRPKGVTKMAISKCPRGCDNAQFELVRQDHIKGANQPMCFVQCTSCNTVIGVTDFYDTAKLLEKIARKVGIPDLLDY